jgi:hypothetical protein
MSICPACREKIKDDALRCKHCGLDLQVKKCPWCAEVIDLNAKKCKHCKSYVDKIPCAGCDDQVEIENMRCANCVAKIIDKELIEQWKHERFKMNLKNWLMLGIIFVLAGYLLFR